MAASKGTPEVRVAVHRRLYGETREFTFSDSDSLSQEHDERLCLNCGQQPPSPGFRTCRPCFYFPNRGRGVRS